MKNKQRPSPLGGTGRGLPLVGRFLSPDNYVQLPDFTQNFNRYSYALNNPLKYVDPDGENPLLIAMLIGALINTGVQAISGNIHNFGDFALSMGIGALSGAAGAIGAGAGMSLLNGFGLHGIMAYATIGGATTTSFFSGATIGAFSGFSAGFVGGAANAWAGGAGFGEGLLSGLKTGGMGALSGGLIGGVAGGVDATIDGRRFFDGATVQEQVLIDKQIPFVRQQGDMNCGPANCEAISISRGGSVTQQSIRNSPTLGGDPNTIPLGDADVFKEFSRQSGLKYLNAGRGLNSKELLRYMKSGYDVTYNIKSVPGIGHAVTANKITVKTITKISGRIIKRILVDVMNPAKGQYIRISNYSLTNAYNSFLIFP